MTPETRPQKVPGRLIRLNEQLGSKLVELATGHGLSVADYCDRELDAIVTERWRTMLEAKLRAHNPALTCPLEVGGK